MTATATCPTHPGLFGTPPRATRRPSMVVVPITDPAIAALFGLPAGYVEHLAGDTATPTAPADPAGLFAAPHAVPSLPLFDDDDKLDAEISAVRARVRYAAQGSEWQPAMPPEQVAQAEQLAADLLATFARHGIPARVVENITSITAAAIDAVRHTAAR